MTYPGSVATKEQLWWIPENRVVSLLAAPISDTDTTISLVDASDFPNMGAVNITNGSLENATELVYYDGKLGNDLLNCVRGVRSTASAHGTSDSAYQSDVKEHHNKTTEEVVAIETELGASPSGTFSTVADRLDNYGPKIGTLETDMLSAQADIVALQAAMSTTMVDVSILQTDVATLQSQVSVLETTVANMNLQAVTDIGATTTKAITTGGLSIGLQQKITLGEATNDGAWMAWDDNKLLFKVGDNDNPVTGHMGWESGISHMFLRSAHRIYSDSEDIANLALYAHPSSVGNLRAVAIRMFNQANEQSTITMHGDEGIADPRNESLVLQSENNIVFYNSPTYVLGQNLYLDVNKNLILNRDDGGDSYIMATALTIPFINQGTERFRLNNGGATVYGNTFEVEAKADDTFLNFILDSSNTTSTSTPRIRLENDLPKRFEISMDRSDAGQPNSAGFTLGGGAGGDAAAGEMFRWNFNTAGSSMQLIKNSGDDFARLALGASAGVNAVLNIREDATTDPGVRINTALPIVELYVAGVGEKSRLQYVTGASPRFSITTPNLAGTRTERITIAGDQDATEIAMGAGFLPQAGYTLALPGHPDTGNALGIATNNRMVFNRTDGGDSYAYADATSWYLYNQGAEVLKVFDGSSSTVQIKRQNYGYGLAIENNGYTTYAWAVLSGGSPVAGMSFDGKYRGAVGSLAVPTYSFFTDPNSGIRGGTDAMGLVAGGVDIIHIKYEATGNKRYMWFGDFNPTAGSAPNSFLWLGNYAGTGGLLTAADTDGPDAYFKLCDGGTHSVNNPRGADLIFEMGQPGPGGTGRYGRFVIDGMATEKLEIVDASSSGGTTGNGWIQVVVGGNTRYFRLEATS